MFFNLIYLYIWKRLALQIALVMLIAASLFDFTFSILSSPSLTVAGWTEGQIFIGIACKIPCFLAATYPAIAGVGALMTFSSLSQTHEIVALQAVGFSKINFCKIILPPAIMFGFFGFFIISYLSPAGYNLFSKINSKPEIIQSAWLEQKNNIINIRKIIKNKLYGIYIFDISKNKIKKFYIAKEADSGKILKLYSVIENNYDTDSVTQNNISKLIWKKLLPDTNFLHLLQISEKKLNIIQLIQTMKIQKAMGLNYKKYEFQLYEIILLPFLTIIMMMIMMQFGFKKNRTNNSFPNAFFGLIISLIFYFFNSIAFPLVELFHIPLFLGVLIAPTSIFVFLPILWLKRP